MASLCNDGGLRRILVVIPGKGRPAIRLGRISEKKATGILGRVKDLEACMIDGSTPARETSAWLATIGDTLRKRLAVLGLAAPKAAEVPAAPKVTLGALVAAYKARPRWKSIAPNTRRNVSSGLAHLVNHFGEAKPIDDIHEADAEDYHAQLMLPSEQGGCGMVEASANQVGSVAHRLCRFAIKSRMIDRSPFEALPKSGAAGNNVEVRTETALAVLVKLTDTQERLLFGLGRWGGLRTPSEPQALRWGDVDWERQRFTVDSPKTGRRTLPIFPELMPLFEARFDEAEPGDEFVLPFMQGRDGAGFSYIIKQAIRRAGLAPWPRLWHSMRSSRETELAATHPLHVCAAWIGNSPEVAMRHYLKVGERDFEAAQKAAQPTPASTRTDAQTETAANSD